MPVLELVEAQKEADCNLHRAEAAESSLQSQRAAFLASEEKYDAALADMGEQVRGLEKELVGVMEKALQKAAELVNKKISPHGDTDYELGWTRCASLLHKTILALLASEEK